MNNFEEIDEFLNSFIEVKNSYYSSINQVETINNISQFLKYKTNSEIIEKYKKAIILSEILLDKNDIVIEF